MKRILLLITLLFSPALSHGEEIVDSISEVSLRPFDGSISYEAECGDKRVDCKVTFGEDAIEISDESRIPYSSILSVVGNNLNWGPVAPGVECGKELPVIPYTRQAKGFPCLGGMPAFYLLISHKSANKNEAKISAFSFKNAKTYYQMQINAFAAKHVPQAPLNTVDVAPKVSWSQHLDANPSLKLWIDANPSLEEKARKEFEENQTNSNTSN